MKIREKDDNSLYGGDALEEPPKRYKIAYVYRIRWDQEQAINENRKVLRSLTTKQAVVWLYLNTGIIVPAGLLRILLENNAAMIIRKCYLLFSTEKMLPAFMRIKILRIPLKKYEVSWIIGVRIL